MAEGKTINLYKGAQYVERIDHQTNNYYYDGRPQSDTSDLKSMIDGLYALEDEAGRVFSDQSQWYAIYRVLSKLNTVPDAMKDFANFINEHKLAEEKPKCSYESIKKASSSLPLFAKDVKLWSNCKDKSEQYMKQYKVAEYLMSVM